MQVFSAAMGGRRLFRVLVVIPEGNLRLFLLFAVLYTIWNPH